jgi:Alternative complex III, ActD subunit
MSDAILGLYADAEAAASAMAALQASGLRSPQLEVLTDSPYPEGAFGEREVHHHLFTFSLVGAVCGFVVGLLFTIGVQIGYPEVQGGKPLLSIPPMINVLYEATLLGAIVVTVAGVIFESRLPDFSGDPYDPRISEGYIGVLVRRPDQGAEDLLRQNGAVDIVARRSG